MLARERGAIINVASTAPFQPLPGNGTYAASKAFVVVAVRTFLSFTLDVELEGRWPWQSRQARKTGSAQ